MDCQESTAALTDQDQKMLRKNLTGGVVFGVFAIIVFAVMIGVMGGLGDQTTYYIFGGFGVFFFGIVAYIIGGSIWDIKSGQKTVYRGKLTNKERFKSSPSGRKSNTRPKYYFYFGDKKVFVSDQHFHLANVGDEIELHYGRPSHTSLAVYKLSGGTFQEVDQHLSFDGTMP